jgi:hypothetical protein
MQRFSFLNGGHTHAEQLPDFGLSANLTLRVGEGLPVMQELLGSIRMNRPLVTCAQFDDREVVYSENGAFATTSAKLGDVYPSTYRTPKSRTMLSKVDSGFRRAMLQRHSLSPFLSARRGNSARIAPCLSCGIRSRPAPRTSAVIPEWVIATSGSL